MPQFYTADKVYRIEGVNGQQFIRVNQQVGELQAQTPDGQSPADLYQMIALAQMLDGQKQAQPQDLPRTQAATESLIRGMTPAM